MINNDILRRLRFAFTLSDNQVIQFSNDGGSAIEKEKLKGYIAKDDEADFILMPDIKMAAFLNGFINFKRGAKEGDQPAPETRLNNNLILRKLKIALSWQDNDMLELLKLAGFNFSKHELSAFFRKSDHRHYRVCKDQVLRNLLKGLQIKLHPKLAATPKPQWSQYKKAKPSPKAK